MKSRKNTALKTIHKYIGVRGGGGGGLGGGRPPTPV